MKGILRIIVEEEDEEAILKKLREIIRNISKDPELFEEYVDFQYEEEGEEEQEIEEEEENEELEENYDEFEER